MKVDLNPSQLARKRVLEATREIEQKENNMNTEKKEKVQSIKVKGLKDKVKVLVQESDQEYQAATPNLGIGKQAKECILKGMNFQQTYELIKARVPNTGFSKKCYAWYKHDLRKKGIIAPVNREIVVLVQQEVKKEETK